MNFLIGCCEKQPIRKLGKRLRSYEKENRSLIPAGDKGRTIRKVMGGVGKKPKKNSCKGKCQEKKFVQRRRERKKNSSRRKAQL